LIIPQDILFEVITPLEFTVRTTNDYWILITEVKHRNMVGQLENVKATLQKPERVILSIADRTVYLFYSKISSDHWMCAVVKRLNGTGFLITAYVTDSIKKGELAWPK
jgi:hypothetical protein